MDRNTQIYWKMQFLPQCEDKWRICFAVCITFGFNKEKFICIPALIACYTEFRVESLAQKGLKASFQSLFSREILQFLCLQKISYVLSVSYYFRFTSFAQTLFIKIKLEKTKHKFRVYLCYISLNLDTVFQCL